MKRIIDLNEEDIKRIVLRVIKEEETNTFKDALMGIANTAKSSFQKLMDELQGKTTDSSSDSSTTSTDKPSDSQTDSKIETKGNRLVIKNSGANLKSYPSNLQERLKKIVPDYYDEFVNQLKNIGVDPEIAARQLYTESGFSDDVIKCRRKSSAGAQGLAQFMPATWSAYGSGSPCDPKQALKAYLKFMGKLMSMFPKRIDLALAGYNWGPSRGILKSALQENKPFTELKSKIPAETYNYTSSILQP